MNLKLVIQYDGTGYSGWQRVKNAPKNKPSIQAFLEEYFANFFDTEVKIIGAGRTDAGVHAAGQVINFYIPKKYLLQVNQNNYDLVSLVTRINKILPEDIKVCTIEMVNQGFHSRLSAKSKTYEYKIEAGIRQSVFSHRYSWPSRELPDINIMRQAAEILVGTHDFRAFSSEQRAEKSTIRTINNISIFKEKVKIAKEELSDRSEITIQITGNGFIYHMVRIIAGTLLEAGTCKRNIETIEHALKSLNRQHTGEMLGPQGLILKTIYY